MKMNKRIKKRKKQCKEAKKILETMIKETAEEIANKLLYGPTGKPPEIKVEPFILPSNIQKEIFKKLEEQEFDK